MMAVGRFSDSSFFLPRRTTKYDCHAMYIDKYLLKPPTWAKAVTTVDIGPDEIEQVVQQTEGFSVVPFPNWPLRGKRQPMVPMTSLVVPKGINDGEFVRDGQIDQTSNTYSL
jgi:hypothetical protein